MVKSDEKDFWKLCISLYDNSLKECQNSETEKQLRRLVFPSSYKFEKIAVTKLVPGIEQKEITKFDSYIIAPFSLDVLERLVNECKIDNKNMDKVLDKYFSEVWIDKNRLLINHIDSYGIMKKQVGNCISSENDCEIYLEYKSFLKTFLTKYFDKVE